MFSSVLFVDFLVIPGRVHVSPPKVKKSTSRKKGNTNGISIYIFYDFCYTLLKYCFSIVKLFDCNYLISTCR